PGLGLRGVQPAHRPPQRRRGACRRTFPAAHRPCAAPRRQLLPDLPSLREHFPTSRRASRHPGFLRRQGRDGSGRRVPERLVSRAAGAARVKHRMTRDGREVALLLWSCILLFAARVIGQFEALVASPAWLPDMDAWYSGLLPYYLLLPVQIALLMIMA